MSLSALALVLAQIAPADPVPAADEQPSLVVPIVHVVTLMTVMRTTESFIWPDPFSRTQYFGARYEEAFTKPPIFDASRRAFEWDGDPWYINTLGHGLFGSELYMRARTCHVPWYGSLAFAAASSAVWEYAFEGNGVRPSALDLVYTPLGGMLLGEARYIGWSAAQGIRAPALRQTVRAVIDPFGELERALGTGC